jgi:hypothetical protein
MSGSNLNSEHSGQTLLSVVEHKGAAALPREVKLKAYERKRAKCPRKPRGN